MNELIIHDRLTFVIAACAIHGSVESVFWNRQFGMYQDGIRNAMMHDFTLGTLSQVEVSGKAVVYK